MFRETVWRGGGGGRKKWHHHLGETVGDSCSTGPGSKQRTHSDGVSEGGLSERILFR